MLLAIGAAVAIKAPALFGLEFGSDGASDGFYLRNLALFCMPFLAAHLAGRHGGVRGQLATLLPPVAVAALFANLYPFEADSNTGNLLAVHLPVLLWAVVGVAHSGSAVPSAEARLGFVRFTGEWLIRYALLALGGMVLIALGVGAFTAVGVDDELLESTVANWVLPCGAMGAVVVAAWMAEDDRGPVALLAPALARIFTPLFTVFLAVLLATAAVLGGTGMEREVLVLFDLLLVVVLGLLLYTTSAREPSSEPVLLDRLQALLIALAVAVDAVALAGTAERVARYGLSPNRTAALGLNLLLLANLAWSLVLMVGFLRGRRRVGELEAWQAAYLPVYAAWAAFVVVVFPPAFGFG